MGSIKPAMESGFMEFLTEHKANPSTRISLVQFDGANPYEPVYTARPITDVPEFKLEPRGTTPLLDALCRTIDETGRRLAQMTEGDRPNKVLFIVITDGEENASHGYTKADVRTRIAHQQDKYNWQFVYLGANHDAIATAKDYGMPVQAAITYTASLDDTWHKMRGLASNTLNYAISGNSNDLKWSNDQRADATGGTGLTITPDPV
jgi:uncharacterized protein YegL